MNYFRKIEPRYRYTLLATLVFGLLSQGMGLFNKFSWHDDALCLFSVGTTFSSGRWMLGLLEQLDFFIFGSPPASLPLTNGMLAIIMIGASSCLLVSLFRIKGPLLSCLIGGIMVSFPGLTGLFGYTFTLPYYAAGILLSIAGAYLLCTGRSLPLRLIGIPLITCSLGIYQAYFPVALCCLLFYLIIYSVDEAGKPSGIILKAVFFALSVIISMLLYFLVTRLSLSICHIQLNDYMGIDRMGQSPVAVYLERALFAYKIFFSQDTSAPYYMFAATSRRIYLLICIFSVLLSSVVILHQFRKQKAIAVLIALFICLIPLAVNFVFVMADPEDVHSLMTYGQVFVFIYFVCLLDRINFRSEKPAAVTRAAGLALLLLISVMFCRYDNQCYLKAALSQQEAISYFTTMVTQIKSVDGYRDNLPVFVVNDYHIEDSSMTHFSQLDHVTQNPFGDMEFFINNYNWKNFVKNWCGFSPEWRNGNEVLNLPEVGNMPRYPDEGSIILSDEKIIIRF